MRSHANIVFRRSGMRLVCQSFAWTMSGRNPSRWQMTREAHVVGGVDALPVVEAGAADEVHRDLGVRERRLVDREDDPRTAEDEHCLADDRLELAVGRLHPRVHRHDDPHVMTTPAERTRKGRRNVAEAPRLGERRHFG